MLVCGVNVRTSWLVTFLLCISYSGTFAVYVCLIRCAIWLCKTASQRVTHSFMPKKAVVKSHLLTREDLQVRPICDLPLLVVLMKRSFDLRFTLSLVRHSTELLCVSLVLRTYDRTLSLPRISIASQVSPRIALSRSPNTTRPITFSAPK